MSYRSIEHGTVGLAPPGTANVVKRWRPRAAACRAVYARAYTTRPMPPASRAAAGVPPCFASPGIRNPTDAIRHRLLPRCFPGLRMSRHTHRNGTSQAMTLVPVRPGQTRRPAEAGLPYKDQPSRISSQHHRCNGKSFQCPSNVTTFRGYTLLWASALLSFPCSCYYAPIHVPRNPGTPRQADLFDSLHKCSTAHLDAVNLLRSVRIEPVHVCDCVHTARHAGHAATASAPQIHHMRTNPHPSAHHPRPGNGNPAQHARDTRGM